MVSGFIIDLYNTMVFLCCLRALFISWIWRKASGGRFTKLFAVYLILVLFTLFLYFWVCTVRVCGQIPAGMSARHQYRQLIRYYIFNLSENTFSSAPANSLTCMWRCFMLIWHRCYVISITEHSCFADNKQETAPRGCYVKGMVAYIGREKAITQ